MFAQSIYKVPDGKLLRISLDYAEDTIRAVQIHGDFFLHPEEAIQAVEGSLAGCTLERQDIIGAVQEILDQFGAECIGADANSFATAILIAAGKLSP